MWVKVPMRYRTFTTFEVLDMANTSLRKLPKEGLQHPKSQNSCASIQGIHTMSLACQDSVAVCLDLHSPVDAGRRKCRSPVPAKVGGRLADEIVV